MRSTHQLVFVFLAACVGVMPCEVEAQTRDSNVRRVCVRNQGTSAILVKEVIIFNGDPGTEVGRQTFDTQVAAGTKKTFTVKTVGSTGTRSVTVTAASTRGEECLIERTFGVPECNPTICFGNPIDNAEFGRCVCIPSVSEWGLMALTLLILTGGTVVVRSRPAAA